MRPTARRPSRSQPSAAVLTAQLAVLEARVAALEARLAPAPRPPAAAPAVARPQGGRPGARCAGCSLELPRGFRGAYCVWCGFDLGAVRPPRPVRRPAAPKGR